ncbi:MAG: MFS transporter, partial [Opitutaceae bacterium]|nr:MFS transporter [Opitutaceae bacterium]
MSLSDLARATKTPSRRRLVLILAFLAAFGPLATDMYLPALPELAADLSCGDAAAQLTISIFLAGVALSQLLYGPVSDAIGRRRPLLFGTALFAVASAVCALAPDVGTLTAGRLLMALGGAAGMVLSRAVVRDLFSGREVAEVFSLLMVIMGAAPILAPLLGGQILL